jgi:hypothetical protein
MLDTWVSPDPGRARDIIPAWSASLWQKLGLDLEGFIEKLRDQADAVVSASAEGQLIQIGESLITKGWLSRSPDPAQVGHALVEWDRIIGHPASSANRPLTPIEERLRSFAADMATVAHSELATTVPHLIDDPKFRLAGSEEGARQLIADLNRMGSALFSQADQLDKDALANYELLTGHAHGTTRAQTAVITEALKRYPRQRFQATLARRAARTYEALKESMTHVKNEVTSCRQRLLAYKTVLLGEIEQPTSAIGPNQIMPPGCFTIEDASKRYLDILTDDDLHDMETWVQAGIEKNYGGVYEACLNTTEGASGLLDILRQQTRAYLDKRLGDVDFTAMFEQKFGSLDLVVEAFQKAHADAAPALVGSGPWSQSAVTVFAAPPGESGDAVRHAAYEALPEPDKAVFADAPDEAVLYREYPQVPLAALPYFGTAWQAAYDTAFDTIQCSPHTRIDIPQWISVDAE